MKIRQAWNLKSLPLHYVVQLQDDSYKMFYITPFRDLTDKDLLEYNGHDPRSLNGQPMPTYLYPFYGLELIEDETKSESLRVRLTPTQLAKVKAAGAPNTVIRDLIDKYL